MTQPPERSTGKIVLMSCLVVVGLFATVGTLAVVAMVFFMDVEDGPDSPYVYQVWEEEDSSATEAIEFEPVEPEGGAPDLFDDLDSDQ